MQIVVTLSPRLQRIIAVTLAAVPVFVLGVAFTSFVGHQTERHRQAAFFTRKLIHERAILAQAPVWQEKLSDLRTSSEWQSLFVAKRQSPLLALIRTSGGKIAQSSATRMETSGATELDEHVIFSATVEQLSKVLQSLRDRRPVFVLRSIFIESQQAAEPQTAPNVLHIELTVAEFEHPS